MIYVSIICLVSCDIISLPKDVRHVLSQSGHNRQELEKVLDYYQNLHDKEKLKAVYFLICNMEDKYAISYPGAKQFESFFNILDSLNKANINPLRDSPYLNHIWDSIIASFGSPSFSNALIIPDYKEIKTDFLISNIDLAFKTRAKLKWAEKISFDNFLEYVLAYRYNNEALENWRLYFTQKYGAILETVSEDSCYAYSLAINKILPLAQWYQILMNYPFDLTASRIDSIQKGNCKNIVVYTSMLMRSFGIPVAIDYAPLWANHSSGHEWNVVFTENNRPIPFERRRDTLRFASNYRPAKVYRKTYSKQTIKIPSDIDEIPETFKNFYRIDVTHEYSKTYDIDVPLIYPNKTKNKISVICTFDNKNWSPQSWGKIKNGKAHFKNMGSNVVYLAMFYKNGVLFPASDPFILLETGKLKFLIPTRNKHDFMIYRKYRHIRQNYTDDMVDGIFEGSNFQDFSVSDILYTIKDVPNKIETVKISNSLKYKYLRFRPAFPQTGNVAELEFYGGDKFSDTLKLTGKVIGFPTVPTQYGTPYFKAFDGNLETYFDRASSGEAWAGMEFDEPKRITKIRYCPRSDTNFILIGDTYDLCYWQNGMWKSLGVKLATDQVIIYKDVPLGALYILHDLTRGKEERIFTYENGVQIWW